MPLPPVPVVPPGDIVVAPAPPVSLPPLPPLPTLPDDRDDPSELLEQAPTTSAPLITAMKKA